MESLSFDRQDWCSAACHTRWIQTVPRSPSPYFYCGNLWAGGVKSAQRSKTEGDARDWRILCSLLFLESSIIVHLWIKPFIFGCDVCLTFHNNSNYSSVHREREKLKRHTGHHSYKGACRSAPAEKLASAFSDAYRCVSAEQQKRNGDITKARLGSYRQASFQHSIILTLFFFFSQFVWSGLMHMCHKTASTHVDGRTRHLNLLL